ncbi:MAG TPA: GPP34 family phosphoprotein [Phycisphaerae bacterium]|nr:GPP34 family phosphoprotein [Phycisphaerae bacterium]
MPTSKRKPPLYCHEEILLLALKDEDGTVEWQAKPSYSYAIAGGILAELLLAERIAVTDDEQHTVNALDIAPLGEPVLDDCLNQVYTDKGRKTLQDWVVQFGRTKKLGERMAEGLCAKGVLKKEEGKALLVLRRTKYPERDAGPERRMIERLRGAVFTDEKSVDARTAILISLAHGAGLLDIPFAVEELQPRNDRIKQITAGQFTQDAPGAALESLRAAALAASLIPAMVVLADANH